MASQGKSTDWTRVIVITLSIVLVGAIIYYFRNIVAYILIAWVLSFIGAPIMRFLLQTLKLKKLKRIGVTIAALITIFIQYGTMFGLIMVFAPTIIEQAQNLANINYDNLRDGLAEPIRQFDNWAKSMNLIEVDASAYDQIATGMKNLFNPAALGQFIESVFSLAANFIIGLFTVSFILFFFLQDQGLFTNFIVRLVPDKYDNKVRQSISQITEILTRYFIGIISQVTTITVFMTILLTVLGVDNALLIGFFAAVINLVPYLGPILGGAFGVLLTVTSNLDMNFYNDMLPQILKIIGAFVTMQLVDNFIIQPTIFSRSVHAEPLEIFIVTLMGAQIGGVTGMILAIPTYSVIRVIAHVFLSQFEIIKRFSAPRQAPKVEITEQPSA